MLLQTRALDRGETRAKSCREKGKRGGQQRRQKGKRTRDSRSGTPFPKIGWLCGAAIQRTKSQLANFFLPQVFLHTPGVMDVHVFGFSAPKCLFFSRFRGPARSLLPRTSTRMTPGRPRDIYPARKLSVWGVLSFLTIARFSEPVSFSNRSVFLRFGKQERKSSRLRKSKTPRKLPQKWTFLSLAFYNAPSWHIVNYFQVMFSRNYFILVYIPLDGGNSASVIGF